MVEVTIGDMATTRVDDSFGLVYLVYNTNGNLTTQEQQVECFASAAAQTRWIDAEPGKAREGGKRPRGRDVPVLPDSQLRSLGRRRGRLRRSWRRRREFAQKLPSCRFLVTSRSSCQNRQISIR